MNFIEPHIQDIKPLCMKYNVEKLSAFGSVLTDRFTSSSDVDLLVTFKKQNISDYFSNFFDFKSDLEKLLNRNVDLVEEQYLSNPYLMTSINSNKCQIYG